MDVLHAWQQASAIVLSCPGALRRHAKSLLPLADLALPQIFLGGESQLAAFAAAASARTRQKMLFAPLPEMFSGQQSLAAAFRALGRTPPDTAGIVHLRFGSVRDARVLKGVANAAVLAERAVPPPHTTSHHPFASGTVLPAAIQGVFLYGPEGLRPVRTGGAMLPSTELPAACISADVTACAADPAGLDMVSLADFDADLWAACGMPAGRNAGRGAIVVPWNLAHFGSIVPGLLSRLADFWHPDTNLPLVLLPFNDAGQTDLLRQLVKQVCRSAPKAATQSAQVFFARVTRPGGLAALRKLSRFAWVDGNDPEAWWSLARLQAAGFDPILIDPDTTQPGHGRRIPADEPIWVPTDTFYGSLRTEMRQPSYRVLPALLALSKASARR